MRSRVYVTVERPSVRPSICLSVASIDSSCSVRWFAAERPVGRRYRSTAARPRLLQAHGAVVQQAPALSSNGAAARRSAAQCHEHITNSVIGVSRPPVLDCGMTFNLDYGGRDLPSTLSDNL